MKFTHLLPTLLAFGAISLSSGVIAADDHENHEIIEKVMKEGLKGDDSPLALVLDGQAVDVVWYDEQQGYAYTPCNGAALINALNQTPPPLNGEPSGIGTWTNGALLRARARGSRVPRARHDRR